MKPLYRKYTILETGDIICCYVGCKTGYHVVETLFNQNGTRYKGVEIEATMNKNNYKPVLHKSGWGYKNFLTKEDTPHKVLEVRKSKPTVEYIKNKFCTNE